MSAVTLGECPRVGCSARIVVVESGNTWASLHHTCTGKPYTTKPREYTDGH